MRAFGIFTSSNCGCFGSVFPHESKNAGFAKPFTGSARNFSSRPGTSAKTGACNLSKPRVTSEAQKFTSKRTEVAPGLFILSGVSTTPGTLELKELSLAIKQRCYGPIDDKATI